MEVVGVAAPPFLPPSLLRDCSERRHAMERIAPPTDVGLIPSRVRVLVYVRI